VKKPYCIVIAEDHTILREGLRSLLSSNPDFDVAGEAEDGRDAVRSIKKFKPDLVLMDLSMPKMDGLDAIREIKKQSPDTKVLVLTVHKAEEYVFASLKAGADGYVLKDATHAELTLAIESVLGGKPYISPGISEKLVAGYLGGSSNSRVAGGEDSGQPLAISYRQLLPLPLSLDIMSCSAHAGTSRPRW